MRFSRQGYWSGLPFPSPGDIPNPGIEPSTPALQADSLPSKLQGKPLAYMFYIPSPIYLIHTHMCNLIMSSKNVFPQIDTFFFFFYLVFNRRKQSLTTFIHGRDPGKLNKND